MRYVVLATDYDGTLAQHGKVSEKTYEALERLKKSGRKVFLVTGRELEDLLRVFPDASICDCIIAENGAVLYYPEERKVRTLAEPPPKVFIETLRERNVQPLSVGRVIVATREPLENEVMQVIHDLGLELQIIFNKGAVMVLPAGVNKATGLLAALAEQGYDSHNVVGIGDAENDHAFLKICECSIAVSNAVPALKQTADFVSSLDHGAGVVDLIDRLLSSDLQELEPRMGRHKIAIGNANGNEIFLDPYGKNVLIAGISGGGKTTFAAMFLEKLKKSKYQFCIFDPEGDYTEFPGCIVFGSRTMPPDTDELITVLKDTEENVVINLLGIDLQDRPAFFEKLFPRLQQMRSQRGRPHWLILDETHHLVPEGWDPSSILPQRITGMMMITVHPQHISKNVLSVIDVLIGIGDSPSDVIAQFAERFEKRVRLIALPRRSEGKPSAILWNVREDEAPIAFVPQHPESKLKRHVRKYAEGDVGPERSFYFQGSEGKLNLRVENLITFVKIAEGVDNETWLHHLKRGEYSRWFREIIKDEELAAETERIEQDAQLSPEKSRAGIKEAIEQRYTAPA